MTLDKAMNLFTSVFSLPWRIYSDFYIMIIWAKVKNKNINPELKKEHIRDEVDNPPKNDNSS